MRFHLASNSPSPVSSAPKFPQKLMTTVQNETLQVNEVEGGEDMGLGPDGVNDGARDAGKSKGRKKNKDVVEVDGSGSWWMKFRFLASCMTLRYKADGSSSGDSGKQAESKPTNDKGRDQPVALVSSTNSNSRTARLTPNLSRELKISSQLRKFSFNELKLVTRNFQPQNLLGQGGFGCVFKGWISQDGITPGRPGMGLAVAVKTLNHHGLQGHKEWLAEVNYLGELLHPNLVKLIGYCIEDEKRLLVYEFMPRGSLESHLFRRYLPLPWSIRMKIMLGAAKGLAFLHEEAEKRVIFRDFKTSNILLDGNYNAKLSDFGLAKDGPVGDSTHVSTQVMGTYGYAAPEYVMTGHLTSKSDVYSFGVVLLEMLTGRRAIDKNRPKGEHMLVEWARPQLGNRQRFYELIDPRLEGHFSSNGAQKAIWLAAHCLCRDPKARPLMSELVEDLKSLPDLNDDMFCSSSSFQAMQAAAASHSAKHAPRTQPAELSRTGSSPRSMPGGVKPSPSHHRNHPLASPKPHGFQASSSPRLSPKPIGFHSSPSPLHHGFQASPSPRRSPTPNASQASPSHSRPLHSPYPTTCGVQASPCHHHSHSLRSPKPNGGRP